MRNWKAFSFEIGFVAAALCGCSGGGGWMPLREGASSTYTVRNGYATFVEPIRVVRRLSVAGVSGWELTGGLGTSRLAWSGDTLLAERYANARFAPPIPILIGDGKPAQRKWKGRVETPVGYFEAEAELQQSLEKIKIGSRSFSALKTRLRLFRPGHESEILAWYAEGNGLLRQEQRTDGKLDVSLELLAPGR